MSTPAKRIREIFTATSRVSYLLWQALGRRWDIQLRLREGLKVLVRAAPKTDYWVLAQVFFTREYQSPTLQAGGDVRRILDLGSNVGYTLIYWAKEFPHAKITGYEPVAAHCAQAREHLRLNGLVGRVDLREAAVGARAMTGYIADRGSDSVITLEPEEGAVRIPVVDLFEEVSAGEVDLLKMDIEGAEYELVGDGRFGTLGARHVVLEWHEWKSRPAYTKQWLVGRLQGYGYQVRDAGEAQSVGENLRVGTIWASLV